MNIRTLWLFILSGGTIMVGILYWSSFDNTINQCGTTAAEARAMGCRFEVTSFSWLPTECHNEGIDGLMETHDIHYYRDENRTVEVDIAEVRLGEAHGFFVSPNYHAAHCALLFQKLHMATKRGGKVDGLITSLHHTSHCVGIVLSNPAEVALTPQYAFTKWPYCGKEGGYNVHFHQQGRWTG